MSSKTIQLNGKHYDAVTGAPVKVEVTVVPKVTKVTTPAKRGTAQKARKPQASRTLMRSSVKRPTTLAGATSATARHIEPKYVEIPVKKVPTDATASKKAPGVHGVQGGNIFEQAIANSTHHRDVHREVRHHKKKVRSSRMQIGAGLAGLLLLAGFAAYQNTPGMQLKVAGMRAGIATASNPDYSVAGFAFQGVQSSGSKRVVALKDETGHNYNLVQQKTTWSEDDMLGALGSIDRNGVLNYEVVQSDSGAQLYRFENGTVTWIDGGVLNQLDNSAGLSDDQILSLSQQS